MTPRTIHTHERVVELCQHIVDHKQEMPIPNSVVLELEDLLADLTMLRELQLYSIGNLKTHYESKKD